uniref:Uncharacterized protein n=1 Tax=Knipowitschia caucasica TaxID=637954 RepID=A0AAV2LAR2_KNICA
MADLALLEDVHAALRRERTFRDWSDFLSESDDWLLSRFHLPRHVLVQLFEKLEPQLGRQTRRSRAIPVPLQVLSTLGVLATGSFQREIAESWLQISVCLSSTSSVRTEARRRGGDVRGWEAAARGTSPVCVPFIPQDTDD